MSTFLTVILCIDFAFIGFFCLCRFVIPSLKPAIEALCVKIASKIKGK